MISQVDSLVSFPVTERQFYTSKARRGAFIKTRF